MHDPPPVLSTCLHTCLVAGAQVKRELGGLGDGLAARSSQLQQGGRKMGADALKLRKWLDSDGNRGQFRRPVHGPVALDVNIAKY